MAILCFLIGVDGRKACQGVSHCFSESRQFILAGVDDDRADKLNPLAHPFRYPFVVSQPACQNNGIKVTPKDRCR